MNAQLRQGMHFFLHNGLGQTEFRDPVGQYPAGQMQRFKYGDIVTHPGQLSCTGQSGRTGTDHRHLVPVGNRFFWFGSAVGIVPVRCKTFQSPDGNRLAFLSPYASLLTLGLLRADPSAYGRQSTGICQDLIGFFKVAVYNLPDKSRDINLNRAAADTWLILAMQAAPCLIHCLFLCIAQRNL